VSLKNLGDIKQAQKHFQKVLDIEAPEEPRSLARNGLRENEGSGSVDAGVATGSKSLPVSSHAKDRIRTTNTCVAGSSTLKPGNAIA
jgi:hypothetical protein